MFEKNQLASHIPDTYFQTLIITELFSKNNASEHINDKVTVSPGSHNSKLYIIGDLNVTMRKQEGRTGHPNRDSGFIAELVILLECSIVHFNMYLIKTLNFFS